MPPRSASRRPLVLALCGLAAACGGRTELTDARPGSVPPGALQGGDPVEHDGGLDGGAPRGSSVRDAGSHDATGGEGAIDVATACLRDASILVLTGDDGVFHSGPPTILESGITFSGYGWPYNGNSQAIVTAGSTCSIDFYGPMGGGSLGVGTYTNAVYAVPGSASIRLTLDGQTASSLEGTEFTLLDISYLPDDNYTYPVSLWSLTAVFQIAVVDGRPLDQGCVHYQR